MHHFSGAMLLRGDFWFSGICIGGRYAKKVLGKNEDYVLFFHITYDCVMYTEYILQSWTETDHSKYNGVVTWQQWIFKSKVKTLLI
jgi:hypothetical protein